MVATEEVAVKISASDAASPKLRAVKASVDSLESSTQRAQSSTRSWGGAYTKLQSSTQGFQTGLSQTVNRGIVGLGALTVAGIGFGLKTASSLEQSQVAFETMFKSADKAKAFTGELQQFAKATPFDLPGVTRASQRLLAYGFNAKEVLPTLTALGDASAGLGAGTEGLDSMTRALGQIKAKGRVQTEELLQFQEAGVPAMDILSKGLGISGVAFTKAVESGMITADKAIPILTKGLEDRFGGLMQRQSKTLAGTVSNLKDSVSLSLAGALQPAIPVLTSALPKLAVSVGAAIADVAPKLPALVDSLVTLAPVAVEVAGAFVSLASSAAPAIKTVTDFLGPDGIKGALFGLVALRGAFAVASGAQAVGGVVGSFQTVMDTAGKLNDSFTTVSDMSTRAAAALKLITGASAVTPAAAAAGGAGAGAGAAAGAGAVAARIARVAGPVAIAAAGYSAEKWLNSDSGAFSLRGSDKDNSQKYIGQPVRNFVKRAFTRDSSPAPATPAAPVSPFAPGGRVSLFPPVNPFPAAGKRSGELARAVPVSPFTPGVPPSVKRGADVPPYTPGPRQQPQRDVVSVSPAAPGQSGQVNATFNTGGVVVNNPTSNVDVTKAVQDGHDGALKSFVRERQARG